MFDFPFRPGWPGLLLVLSLLSSRAGAQVQSISLEEVVQAALAHSPAVAAAELTNQRNVALENAPYRPGRTELGYRGNGLFRANALQVNEFYVTQWFDHPAGVRTERERRAAVSGRGRVEARMAANEIVLRTREVYHRYQERTAVANAYAELADELSVLFRIAEERSLPEAEPSLAAYRIGRELRATEKRAARAQQDGWVLMKQLQNLTGLRNILLPADTFVRMPPPGEEVRSGTVVPPGITTSGAPISLALAEGDINVARAGTGTALTGGRPAFRIGYSAQQYLAEGYLSGIEAGVSLPLFRAGLRRRVEAAELDVLIAYERLGVAEQRYYDAYWTAERERVRTLDLTQFYEDEVAEKRAYVLRLATDGYVRGSVGYRELLEVFREAATDRIDYLGQLLAHNLAVARLHHLEAR